MICSCIQREREKERDTPYAFLRPECLVWKSWGFKDKTKRIPDKKRQSVYGDNCVNAE